MKSRDSVVIGCCLALALSLVAVHHAMAAQKPLKPKKGAVETTEAAAPTGEAILEDLLDETGLVYQRQTADDDSIRYRIAIEASGETTMITARIHTWQWKRPDDSPLQSVYCFTQIQSPPENGEAYPHALLDLLARKSDTLLTGNYSATNEGVFANSGFYLPGLDADALESYLYALHWNRVNLVTDLDAIQTDVEE